MFINIINHNIKNNEFFKMAKSLNNKSLEIFMDGKNDLINYKSKVVFDDINNRPSFELVLKKKRLIINQNNNNIVNIKKSFNKNQSKEEQLVKMNKECVFQDLNKKIKDEKFEEKNCCLNNYIEEEEIYENINYTDLNTINNGICENNIFNENFLNRDSENDEGLSSKEFIILSYQKNNDEWNNSNLTSYNFEIRNYNSPGKKNISKANLMKEQNSSIDNKYLNINSNRSEFDLKNNIEDLKIDNNNDNLSLKKTNSIPIINKKYNDKNNQKKQNNLNFILNKNENKNKILKDKKIEKNTMGIE